MEKKFFLYISYFDWCCRKVDTKRTCNNRATKPCPKSIICIDYKRWFFFCLLTSKLGEDAFFSSSSNFKTNISLDLMRLRSLLPAFIIIIVQLPWLNMIFLIRTLSFDWEWMTSVQNSTYIVYLNKERSTFELSSFKIILLTLYFCELIMFYIYFEKFELSRKWAIEKERKRERKGR